MKPDRICEDLKREAELVLDSLELQCFGVHVGAHEDPVLGVGFSVRLVVMPRGPAYALARGGVSVWLEREMVDIETPALATYRRKLFERAALRLWNDLVDRAVRGGA